MTTQVRIGILGATSYTGLELVRLLARHHDATISWLSSRTYAGQHLSAVFPELTGICDQELLAPEQVTEKAVDCIFSCLPHAVSAQLLMPFVEKGARIVDLSADFRLKDAGVYEAWYRTTHPCPERLSEAVYGLCEHNREAIAKARIIANPGCYPTSILLPLLPLLKENGADIGTIIADSKSGVSGAGRTLKQASHFVEANENLSAYATGHKHRHVPEMEQELSGAAGAPIRLTFSPHLIPLNRGMLSTMYLNGKGSPGDYWDILNRAYEAERFVQVRELHELPSIRHVANTNGCAIGVTDGGIEGQVVIVSVIDNLLKGASGQALQSMNIMFGLPEESGLWP